MAMGTYREVRDPSLSAALVYICAHKLSSEHSNNYTNTGDIS